MHLDGQTELQPDIGDDYEYAYDSDYEEVTYDYQLEQSEEGPTVSMLPNMLILLLASIIWKRYLENSTTIFFHFILFSVNITENLFIRW